MTAPHAPYRPVPDAIIAEALSQITFNAAGLVPAIAQRENGEILMMAWMNTAAITETLQTGRVCYYSRSRKGLWRKGESSGQTQHLLDFRYDCDGDTILMLVTQKGVACHTGRPNCFYNAVRPDGIKVLTEPVISQKDLYGK
jgi:phosphoribosyl-AMP cyclohydrolase